MSELGIQEVGRRARLASSALRYYEREGLLPRAHRRNGRRFYDEDVLERLAVIELAKRAGFTIAEIKRLFGGFDRRTPPGERWRRLANDKFRELDERIAETQRMQALLRVIAGCECPTFEDCARALRASESGRRRFRGEAKREPDDVSTQTKKSSAIEDRSGP
jgi:MerR family transcriptional regulator, redox-sensitive transcriptional activator SoxR